MIITSNSLSSKLLVSTLFSSFSEVLFCFFFHLQCISLLLHDCLASCIYFRVVVSLSFPGSSADKESTCNAGDPVRTPESGTSSGEGVGYPLQYSWASLVAQTVKNPPAMREIWVRSLVGKIPWRRERLPTPVFWPGEFHGLYSPWGHKESGTTD